MHNSSTAVRRGFGFVGVAPGVPPPTSTAAVPTFGAIPRIRVTGTSGFYTPRRTTKKSLHTYEKPSTDDELRNWRPISKDAPSAGFDASTFDNTKLVLTRPACAVSEDDTDESEVNIATFLKSKQTISKDEYKLARKGFTDQNLKDFEYKNQVLDRVTNARSKLKLSGLAPSTFRQYHSKVLTVINEGYPPTLLGLCDLLAERALQEDARFFAHSSLSTWRSAIVHFGVGLGYYYPTERDIAEFNKVKRGLKGMNAEGVTKVKGAITRKLVDQMVKWAEKAPGVPKEDRRWFVDGIIVQHAFGLRTSEVCAVSNLNTKTVDDSAEYLHVCPKNKDALGYNRDDMKIEKHFSDVHWKAHLDRISNTAKKENDDERWVPGWTTWKANRYVKLCAVESNWDENLFWSNHGIRHGSAVDAARDAKASRGISLKTAQDNAVFRRTAQLSESMRRFYAEPPDDRSDRALEVHLISHTHAELQDLRSRVEKIRNAVKTELNVRNEEEVDDFNLTFEDESALADCTAAEFVQLLQKTMKKYKTTKATGDSDSDDDEEKPKKTKKDAVKKVAANKKAPVKKAAKAAQKATKAAKKANAKGAKKKTGASKKTDGGRRKKK